MIQLFSTTSPTMWVAVDIGKVHNRVRVEFPHGRHGHFRVADVLTDFTNLGVFLAGRTHAIGRWSETPSRYNTFGYRDYFKRTTLWGNPKTSMFRNFARLWNLAGLLWGQVPEPGYLPSVRRLAGQT
jgi:hypothetical protein